MKKIYSDSEIWNKEWYLKYTLKLRMLLRYIFDNAHTSGVFEPNYIMLSFYMQETVTRDDILALQRIYQEYECLKNPDASLIEELPDGKFWVVGMAYFQCGALSQNTPAHKKVIDVLMNYGLLERVVSQYKENDKKKIGLLKGLLRENLINNNTNSDTTENTPTPETPIEQEVEGETQEGSMGSPNLGLPIAYPSATLGLPIAYPKPNLGLPMAYPSANLALPIAYPSATHRDRDKDRDKDREYLSTTHEEEHVEREREKQAKEREKIPQNFPTKDQIPKTSVRSQSGPIGKLCPESPEVCAFCKDYGLIKEDREVVLSARERQEIARVLNIEGGKYDAEYWQTVFWNAKGGWEFNKGFGNIERSKCSLKSILESHGQIYRKELPLKYLPKKSQKVVEKKVEEFVPCSEVPEEFRSKNLIAKMRARERLQA